MKIPIDEIKVRDGRRELNVDHAHELSESILELGLLNPITIDKDFYLIAGLHRLEAVKLLDWPEVECNVCSLEGLQAELAEIDENLVRHDLNYMDECEQLARRKEIYEMLHPETRQGMRNGKTVKTETVSVLRAKPFAADTAEKIGVDERTIRSKVQIAKKLIPEVKQIARENDIGFKNAVKLSRLEPEQQQEAATLLAAKEIKSVEEYKASKAVVTLSEPEPDELAGDDVENAPAPVPFSLPQERYASFREVVADLKDPNKDCSCSPDSFLAEFTAFIRKYIREVEWYSNPYYQVVFPCLSPEQRTYLHQQMDSIGAANQNLLNQIERNMKS